VAAATNLLDPDAVVAAGRRGLGDADAVRRHLSAKMAELTPLSRENARLAIDLLHRRDQR